MKITVLGAGSIGLLFTAYFASIGHELTVITKSKRQKDSLIENGITLVKKGSNKTYSVKAFTQEDQKQLFEIDGDLLIIAVKQMHIENIAPLVRRISKQFNHLLFIQNGMGHLSFVQQLEHPSTILGVVEHGALRCGDCVVEHTGIGMTKLATYNFGIPDDFAKLLAADDFIIKEELNWYEMLAKKLVINAVINPLTAIFNVKNGELLNSVHFRYLMKGLFEEAVDILKLQNTEELWEQVLRVSETTGKNTSSMLRDIQNKRITENDAISGYLLEKARLNNKRLPNTEFVFNGIKGIEESWNR